MKEQTMSDTDGFGCTTSGDEVLDTGQALRAAVDEHRAEPAAAAS